MKGLKQISFTAVIVLLFFSSGVHGDTWTANQQLTNNAGDSQHPAIAVDGSDLYVVWYDYTPANPEIFFKRSVDGGVSWKADRRLTNNAGFSSTPSLTVDGPNIYVVWWDYDYTTGNSDIYFKRSVNKGVDWKADRRLTRNSGFSCNPAIAAAGSNIFVVWEDDSSGNREIYFKRSANRGVDWTEDKRLSNSSGDSFWPAMAVDGPNVYVVWYDDTPGNSTIFIRRSVDGGVTWEEKKRLTKKPIENPTDYFLPAIAVDGLNIYVAYNGYTNTQSEIYLRRSDDGGITWKEISQITKTTGQSWFPFIAVAGSNVYLAWNDDMTGNDEIYFKRSDDGGVTWTEDKRITSNPAYSWNPAIAADGSDIYLTWVDRESGNDEIYFTKGTLD